MSFTFLAALNSSCDPEIVKYHSVSNSSSESLYHLHIFSFPVALKNPLSLFKHQINC